MPDHLVYQKRTVYQIILAMEKIITLKREFINKDIKAQLEFVSELYNSGEYFSVYCLLENENFFEAADDWSYEKINLKLLLAKVLIGYGCSSTPKKICSEIRNSKTLWNQLKPQERTLVSFRLMSVYFDLYLFKEILVLSEAVLKEITEDDPRYLYIKMTELLSKLDLGQDVVAEFEKTLKKVDEAEKIPKEYKEHHHYFLLCYSWEYGHLNKDDFLKKCNEMLLTSTHSALHYHLLIAEFYQEEGELKKAKDYFSKNVDIEKLKKTPYFYFQYIPVFNNICVEPGRVDDEIMLRCFPCQSHTGYSPSGDYTESSPIIAKRKKWINEVSALNDVSSKESAWLIHSETLSKFRYQDVTEMQNVLDLCAGLLIIDGKKTILSKARTIMIFCIVSSGALGVNEIFLSEKVYFEENIYPKSAVLRTRDLITQIQKMGIPIIRKNKIIYFDRTKWSLPILMPTSYRFEGEFKYFKQFCKDRIIDIHMVTDICEIKRATAASYIKKWKDDNLIVKDEARYGNWKII